MAAGAATHGRSVRQLAVRFRVPKTANPPRPLPRSNQVLGSGTAAKPVVNAGVAALQLLPVPEHTKMCAPATAPLAFGVSTSAAVDQFAVGAVTSKDRRDEE
jgi:hypothetical protein